MKTTNTDDLCSIRCINQKRIDNANQEALSDCENQNMAQLFKAMGDVNRLKVLHALGQDEMCVCDIAKFLKLSESAVSHQLRLLRQLKLVSNRREGPILYYRLNDHHVEELLQVALKHSRE
jgi:DNA-binding transcriptional ArsR family regulator